MVATESPSCASAALRELTEETAREGRDDGESIRSGSDLLGSSRETAKHVDSEVCNHSHSGMTMTRAQALREHCDRALFPVTTSQCYTGHGETVAPPTRQTHNSDPSSPLLSSLLLPPPTPHHHDHTPPPRVACTFLCSAWRRCRWFWWC